MSFHQNTPIFHDFPDSKYGFDLKLGAEKEAHGESSRIRDENVV